ncbi:MAG: hypothetical protein QXN49_06495 [Archaeoglobaceae archaeon]
MKKFTLTIMFLVFTSTALADDFSISSEDFGSVLMRSLISVFNLSQQTFKVLALANNTPGVQATGYMMQNMWGIIYGVLVLAGWQNQILSIALEEIKDNSTHLQYFGLAVNYLGSNATTVFGDTQGTKGFARILNGSLIAINNSSKLYQPGETLLEAYAKSLTLEFYNCVVFLIELAKAIPKAFT